MLKETLVDFDVRDTGLAEQGRARIEWARRRMPVLEQIRERFQRERPLEGIRIAASLHVTTETANLVQTLKAGGAEVRVCGSNPLSTRDDVAASLVVHDEVPVFAFCGETQAEYYRHVASTLANDPHITMDDGADMIVELHKDGAADLSGVLGGIEETTTGVIRVRSMAEQGLLRFPVVAVNDANTKHFFDNRYGTGQNTIDGILRATNILIAGSVFVVCGFGWCGKGIALRARGMGANVIVTEVDSLKALEAVMEGYRVMPIAEAAKIGDVFVTVTGNTTVIGEQHFANMKDGAILANSGHFDVEIDVARLQKIATERRTVRPFVEQYTLPSGKQLNLLAQGRLVGQSAAEASPADVMDMSFANQALVSEFLVKSRGKLENRVYGVPKAIDDAVARLKLEALGVQIDQLSERQQKYLASWELGT